MLTEAALRDALSRHIARAIIESRSTNKLAYAVAVYDSGICPFAAFALARDFIEGTARGSGYADDEPRVLGEEAAFVAGLVVGRTAKDEEVAG
jgi:hypothetical protein